MAIEVCDTNRYHPLEDGNAYATRSPIVIIELDDGWSADQPGIAQRAIAHAAPGIKSVGLYGYIVASQDAYAQGQRMGRTIGRLLPGEFVVGDLEEGAGDQGPRLEAWLAGVHSVVGEAAAEDFGYSGASFWSSHLYSVNNVHRWIAAYGQGNPGLGNVLWQDSDAVAFPGVAGLADCSIYNGTIDDWLALLGSSSGAPSTPQPLEDDVLYIFNEGKPEDYVHNGMFYRWIPNGQALADLQWFIANVAKGDSSIHKAPPGFRHEFALCPGTTDPAG